VLKVREIVVMGHGMCGGCQAALSQSMRGAEPGRGGFIADWISLLDEARDEVAARHGTNGREAERAMEQAGVKVSLANLRTFPCVQAKEKAGDLTLRGAFFAISDGVLHLLDEKSGEFFPA
jgi:carbonic anhydrase